MLRKKIVLLGSTQDKKVFLEQLECVENKRNVYQVGNQEVEMVATIEEFDPAHICSRTLDGFDAAIQLFNDKDKGAVRLQSRIPKEFSSYIYFPDLDTQEPVDYLIDVVLFDIKDKKAYRHQEPGIASYVASLFFGSRKQQAACPVDHTSNAPIELSTFSHSHSSK